MGLGVERDGVWVAVVTKGVVEVPAASEVDSGGQVDMREVAGASVSVKEEGERLSDINTVMVFVKGLNEVA